MKTITGDLIQLAKDGVFDVIIHGCDCYGDMGGGIARSIKKHFPNAFAADQSAKRGDESKLGTYSCAENLCGKHHLFVVNAYTQPHWKGKGVLVDYNAVAGAMRRIKIDFNGKRMGYPKIGAGLANGDWSILSHIIETELEGEDHTLVEYAKRDDEIRN